MLEWLRSLLGLKQLEDDIAMLKTEVDVLQEMAEAVLTGGKSRDTDSEGGEDDGS